MNKKESKKIQDIDNAPYTCELCGEGIYEGDGLYILVSATCVKDEFKGIYVQGEDKEEIQYSCQECKGGIK